LGIYWKSWIQFSSKFLSHSNYRDCNIETHPSTLLQISVASFCKHCDELRDAIEGS
jgi:hypothetical protein